MQVDDRVSIKSINIRPNALTYQGFECRFGASDGVKLLSVKTTVEVITHNISFVGVALSRNPGHLLAPPAAIAPWFLDEALYARQAWGSDNIEASPTNFYEFHWDHLTETLDLHGVLVPSRQIYVICYIYPASCGINSDYYYQEVKLSRAETNLLNQTWGKYRR